MAGAIKARSFRPYRNQRAIEIVVALVVGTAFAIFVGPLAAFWVVGRCPVDIRLLSGLFYILASDSNILIPLAIRKISTFFGQEMLK